MIVLSVPGKSSIVQYCRPRHGPRGGWACLLTALLLGGNDDDLSEAVFWQL